MTESREKWAERIVKEYHQIEYVTLSDDMEYSDAKHYLEGLEQGRKEAEDLVTVLETIAEPKCYCDDPEYGNAPCESCMAKVDLSK